MSEKNVWHEKQLVGEKHMIHLKEKFKRLQKNSKSTKQSKVKSISEKKMGIIRKERGKEGRTRNQAYNNGAFWKLQGCYP